MASLDRAGGDTLLGIAVPGMGGSDKLLEIDEKLNIVPQLATGHEWSAEVVATGRSVRTLGAGGMFIGGATTTSGSTAVTVASTAGLAVGMPISGPGIAAGSTIGAIGTVRMLTPVRAARS